MHDTLGKKHIEFHLGMTPELGRNLGIILGLSMFMNMGPGSSYRYSEF